MAKGASKSAAEELECQEDVAGEYRRAGRAPCIGRSAGYWRSRPSCTVGPRMILIAGSMICSTSWPIPRSCWWRGIGCGATGAPARPGWTARRRCSIAAGHGGRGVPRRAAGALKDRSFRPLPVRERMIPKAGGKLRRLGIATITDRVVQASLKLVLEPIFEADFLPCSYGFRPNRRTHDAVAEVRHFATHSYEWVVEGDIKACFDEISHPALMDRVRERVGDKRVLALVKAFLKAGILGEDRLLRENQRRNPARVDPVPAAEQRGPLGAGRACRPGPRAGRPPPRWNGPNVVVTGLPNYQADPVRR